YRNWLLEHGLEDADSLLVLATAAIHSNGRTPNPPLHAAALWLDGFAEMTPQELDMLAAFLPLCRRATLAFCLEAEPSGDVARLSPWAAVARTFTQCHQRVLAIPDAHVEIEILPRSENAGRFAANTTLRSLESRWSQPPTPPKSEPQNPHLRLVRCADPEAEAVFAAREILRFVREPRHDAGPPNRFRDCAVIVRSLEPYHAALTRIFRRYGIPFFLDRREAVAHHPLAELTRFAVRCAAYDWRSADWFGALKTGLVTPDDDAVDALENEALARGWEGGRFWRQPLPIADDHAHAARLEQLRLRILPPFEQMARALGPQPTGSQIATAVRDLWSALDVETTLERWSDPQLPLSAPGISQSALHQTVFDQTDQWLANVELAFTNETLPLPEWLPVLEAGLAGLSVGVIPPALDQVLIGGIDRSRQPELKLALVLGLNEGVFPAPPATATLLTDAERDLLAGENVQLETDRLQQISRERFYGYIAVTRARERLLLTRADQDSEGRPLNPSPFFTHAGYITGTHEEEFRATPDWWDAEHTTELAADLFQIRNLESLPALAPLVEKHRRLQTINQSTLAAATVRRLYGTELKTSVSALEQFAACPFKYFAARGLKLDERREFEFNARDKGSLQHDVLEEFHKRATANGGSWRKLTPARASDLIAQIGNELLPAFAGGKFQADGAARFTGAHLVARLQRLVTTLIEWMPQYGFDPVAVEVSFDDEHGDLPSWRLDLSDGRALLLRGRIDRVDVCPLPDGTALAVVMDYKSRARELNAAKLHHGLELQLLSYLGVLKQLRDTERIFGAKTLSPAGVFFIPLNGQATTS
ncbi:MAG TPA: PD-(D/E)XK nuclease family protein, partial [Verrucomicrobiota bacterium]|nr:PD-(D/E)XK nuclease family protein [Verrucomicrobiota bacterium]